MTTNLFLILIIAFVIIVLVIAGLAIGWLITGKTKGDKKGSSCYICPFSEKKDTSDSIEESNEGSHKQHP